MLISKNEDAMAAAANSFDFLLNTIPVGHDADPYMNLLKRDGTMVVVGAVEPLTNVNGVPFIFRRRSMAGSSPMYFHESLLTTSGGGSLADSMLE